MKTNHTCVGTKAILFTHVLIYILVWPVCSFAGDYSGGTGEPNKPYRIATPNDLDEIGDRPGDWDKHFVLINDINMADYSYTKALIGVFEGVFDGNDCNISSLTIDTATTGQDNEYLGLFGRIDETGHIKNLGIEDVNITSRDYSYELGGLCGRNYKGTISNCYATGSVTGGLYSDAVGGLVGGNDGTISNCYATRLCHRWR